MVLLDTNVIIEHLSGKFDLTPHVSKIGSASCFVSSVVAYELLCGALRSSRSNEFGRVLRLVDGFSSLPFDDDCAEATDRIRHSLEVRGMRIGPYDLQIARTALAHNLVLVTHNVAGFARVDGLRIEDWQVPAP